MKKVVSIGIFAPSPDVQGVLRRMAKYRLKRDGAVYVKPGGLVKLEFPGGALAVRNTGKTELAVRTVEKKASGS